MFVVYSWLLRNALLPAGLHLTRSRYHARAQEIRRAQYRPAQEMAAWQLSRLRALVDHASRHTSFYGERLAAAGVEGNQLGTLDDVARLPITTKEQVQANFPDRIVATDRPRDDWQFVGSRGTTNRVVVVHDFQRRDLSLATHLVAMTEDAPYDLGQPGIMIPPDDCSTLCGPAGLRAASVPRHVWNMLRQGRWRDPEAQSDLRGLVMENWIRRTTVWEPFGPEGTHIEPRRLEAYLARLHAARPRLLKALPEYLRGMARHLLATGATPPALRVIKPMGAHLAEAPRREIESAFRCPVRMDYGSREMGSMAVDCRHRQGLHVLSDQFLIEVVRDGRPVAPGEVGEVLVTDMHNWAMPLVRYRIGDMARLDTTPCACGRRTPRLHLEGRREDTLVTPDLRLLTPEAVCAFFYSQPGVDEFQLAESPTRFEVQIVPHAGTKSDAVDEAALATGWRNLVGDAGRRLVVRRVSTILPERSGKFRHVKSCSFSRLETGLSLATTWGP